MKWSQLAGAHRCALAHDAVTFSVILSEWRRSAVLIDSNSPLSNYAFFLWAWLRSAAFQRVSGTQKEVKQGAASPRVQEELSFP